MAPRPAWSGYLKLSLVTCAVELTNVVTHAEKVSFHVLNRKTGNRVRRIYVDAESGKPLDKDDEVRGYEVGKDEFIFIEEEDIEAVQIESSHTLNLDGFVDKSSIEQIYLDAPYYVTPADKVSEEAFAVIRDALAEKKMAGLARIVLYQRERPVVVESRGKGMMLTTLRYGDTVREPAGVFAEIKSGKPDSEMIGLAEHIIDKQKGKFDPTEFRDRYQEALLELVRAKKGRQEGAESQGGTQAVQCGQFVRCAEKEPRRGGRGKTQIPEVQGSAETKKDEEFCTGAQVGIAVVCAVSDIKLACRPRQTRLEAWRLRRGGIRVTLSAG